MTGKLQAGCEIAFLESLETVIRTRMTQQAADSYVAALVASGERRMAQKLAEEAVELALAATCGDRREQLEEAADLVFHLLVLLNAKDLRLADVAQVLERRHRTRGADDGPTGR